ACSGQSRTWIILSPFWSVASSLSLSIGYRARACLIKALLRLPHEVFRQWTLQGGRDILAQVTRVPRAHNRCIQIRIGQGEPQGELQPAHAVAQLVQACR